MLLTQTRKQAAVQQEIDALVHIMVEAAPVEQVYLFGSYAYGAPHDDSDLDLYVVFKDDMKMREIDALTTARVAMASVQNTPLDLLGHKNSTFLARAAGSATIEKDIVQKGVKLYG
ncbi:MAG: nucleotidyltransferase domain-containing protein [Spirochaetaceae bacterium]|jgi:predicted nucleotidyltransferase|nr:nucleotidyltransferase domain-containing protein [Spirochaetaceae bacterium]